MMIETNGNDLMYQYMRKHARPERGFTLVELMVVVALIAIISAIAIPSYRQHVQRGARSDLKTVLMENAAFMERFATENNGTYLTAGGVSPVLPLLVSPRGSTGTNVKYNISFVAGEPTNRTYQLQAVPANSMSSDECGTFTINNLGQRESKNTSNGMTLDTCWNK